MTEMPEQYTRFSVETWVESAMRYFTSRNFRVIDLSEPQPDNVQCPTSNVQCPKVLGYGRSIWAMIDTESRQPCDILAVDNGAINNWIEKEHPCPIDKGGRVKMDDDAELVHTIDTYYNDVDINGHINSVKYIEHVLDLWPIDWYRDHAVRRFEIAYVAEAHAGDKLSFYRQPAADASPNSFNVRIAKTASDGSEAVEVCRSKVVFSERV
jgi:acyl-ACP thioesterase